MQIEVKLEYTRFGQIGTAMLRAIDRICEDTALEIHARSQMSMYGPKHGRIYVRRGRIHQASAPGEAPAVDTGHLVTSVITRRVALADYETSYGAKYAAMLEYGTRRILPRPFVRPAINAVARKFFEAIRNVVER